MTRKAFKMFLKPGFQAEYERMHNQIWPELKVLIEESSLCDCFIFYLG